MADKKSIKSLLIGLGVLIVAGIIMVVSGRNRKPTAYTIAFYDVPDTFIEEVKTLVKSKYVGSVGFQILDSSSTPDKKSLKNIDLIFCPDGAAKEKIESIFKGTSKPVLYQTYLLLTMQDAGEYYYVPIPDYFENIIELSQMYSSAHSVPFYYDAKDDKTLINFFGQYILSNGGKENYLSVMEEIKKTGKLEGVTKTNYIKDFIEFTKLYCTSKDVSKPFAIYNSLTDVLENSFIYNNYNLSLVPFSSKKEENEIIAPAIHMISLNSRKATVSLLNYFDAPNIQTAMASETGMIPFSKEAASTTVTGRNIQSLVLSEEYTLLTDYYSSCFMTSQEAHFFAEQIREAIKN